VGSGGICRGSTCRATSGEQAGCGSWSRGPPGERDLVTNVVWCAKEAVLKALGLGLTVDTYAVRCLPGAAPADPGAWALDPGGGAWRGLEIACEPALLPEGMSVHGIWCDLGGGLLGALAVRVQTQTPSPAL